MADTQPVTDLVRRNVETLATETLADTPVLVIQGARQVGKSTLAEQLLATREGRMFNLDDGATLAAAANDPDGFVRQQVPGVMVIDEVQRVPDLLRAVKAAVDADRRPGRFVLTGSADLLRLNGAHESLAGRAETVAVHSFSQGEIAGHREDWVTKLLTDGPDSLTGPTRVVDRIGYAELAVRGGYPEARLRKEGRRAQWFENYLTRVIDHDGAEITRLTRLADVRTVLELLAANTAGELVKARVARQADMPETTLPAYLELLEDLGLIHTIPAWGNNLTQRVVGRPKVAVLDVGLAAHLVRQTSDSLASPIGDNHLGGLLETLVLGELRRQLAWSETRFRLHHFRDRLGHEVDLVVELPDGRVVAIEVKAARSASASHFTGLTFLEEKLGDRLLMGVVLNSTPSPLRFSERLWSAPIASLWTPAI